MTAAARSLTAADHSPVEHRREAVAAVRTGARGSTGAPHRRRAAIAEVRPRGRRPASWREFRTIDAVAIAEVQP